MDVIRTEAAACLTAGDGANFENKIVLSIAARLAAERYMATEDAPTPKLIDLSTYTEATRRSWPEM